MKKPLVQNMFEFSVYDEHDAYQYETRETLDWLQFPAAVSVIVPRRRGRSSLLLEIARKAWLPVLEESGMPHRMTVVCDEETAEEWEKLSNVLILYSTGVAQRAVAFELLAQIAKKQATSSQVHHLIVIDTFGGLSGKEESIVAEIAEECETNNQTLVASGIVDWMTIDPRSTFHYSCHRCVQDGYESEDDANNSMLSLSSMLTGWRGDEVASGGESLAPVQSLAQSHDSDAFARSMRFSVHRTPRQLAGDGLRALLRASNGGESGMENSASYHKSLVRYYAEWLRSRFQRFYEWIFGREQNSSVQNVDAIFAMGDDEDDQDDFLFESVRADDC